MSLNLSEPVTTDGTLKLPQAEYDYLNSFLTANDRGNYYLALYNMTGSQEALLQAEIATFNAVSWANCCRLRVRNEPQHIEVPSIGGSHTLSAVVIASIHVKKIHIFNS
jgi:hypothetical protein